MMALLIQTTGQSDVQVVVDGIRHELDGKICGKLHDEIARWTWSLVEPPPQKGERTRNLPASDLILCTPKLDAVLDFFDGVPPAAALIFETRRALDSNSRLAGTVLERRMRELGVS